MIPARAPVVALKSKTGELDALLHLRPEDPIDVVPLIELLDTVKPDARGRVLPLLIKAGAHMAGRGQPLWIDTRWLSGRSALARTPGGPFRHLRTEIEAELDKKRDLFTPDIAPIVPVISEFSGDETLRALGRTLEPDEHDIALRIRDRDIPTPAAITSVERLIRLTGSENRRLHVIIDAEFVDSPSPHRLLRISRFVSRLDRSIGPASTTLLAGSIPPQRNEFVTATRERTEVSLWQAVSTRIAPLEVRYGDYGVVHPRPPATSTPGPRTAYPYLYYTLSGRSLYLRRKPAQRDGKNVEGAAANAFADLAAEVVARPEFAGAGHSWGDWRLAHCGPGDSPGSVPGWLALATSHHIAYLANTDGT